MRGASDGHGVSPKGGGMKGEEPALEQTSEDWGQPTAGQPAVLKIEEEADNCKGKCNSPSKPSCVPQVHSTHASLQFVE